MGGAWIAFIGKSFLSDGAVDSGYLTRSARSVNYAASAPLK